MKCLNCGTLCDGDCCSLSCVNAMYDKQDAKRNIVPLGCYRCAHCETISGVYEHSVMCDTCADHVCPACIHNPEDIESDETGLHATCEVCWQSEQEPGETREAYER